MINKIIKKRLEESFHVGVDVSAKGKDHYVLSFEQSNESWFVTEVEIHGDLRLIITVSLQKYAAPLMEAISQSSSEKREVFCALWQKFGTKNISIKINDIPFQPEQFVHAPSSDWKKISIRYNRAAYYNEEHESREDVICDRIIDIYTMVLSLVDYTILGYEEGKEQIVTTTKHERNINNRRLCTALKGYKCVVCGFDFEKVYGDIGKNFIEVHHATPVSQMEEGHIVDPIKELFPLCPNCHAMIHRKNPPYTIDELKGMLINK